MIRNINSSFGDPVNFENVAEMEECILRCDYELPADGLKEGRDYETIPVSLYDIADGIWDAMEPAEIMAYTADLVQDYAKFGLDIDIDLSQAEEILQRLQAMASRVLDGEMPGTQDWYENVEKPLEDDATYMNVKTGSVGQRCEWWYKDENGVSVNAVDRGEVIEVEWNAQEENWKEVE
ncbi:MAG: hypothetical protein M0P69_03660 [Bacteroidales bacterium]|nr:hypothetical protein [Bacteroidales bacterium]